MHLKSSISSLTWRVTPRSVRSPVASSGRFPSNLVNLPLNVAVGYLAASKMSGATACWFISSWPKSTELMSTVTSTVPVRASRSSTTTPLDLLNLPRQVDRPPK
ncbi:hypothetical protein D3C72_1979500 [compost metagenome]